MKAILYHRVSTGKQDQGLLLPELRAQVEARGWHVVSEESETGSGARNDRPGLQRVLAAVKARQVDVVVVWKLDRFGRSLVDLLANLGQLQRAGCAFWATSQGLELGKRPDAMQTFMLQVLGAAAEFERSLHGERSKQGQEGGRRRGSRIGRPVVRPDGAAVAELRDKVAPRRARSWARIADTLGCSATSARRAYDLYKAQEAAAWLAAAAV